MKTKRTRIIVKFGARYGSTVKHKFGEVASKQKQRQQCPFCKKYSAKRTAKGLWLCASCGKKFTDAAYYLSKRS